MLHFFSRKRFLADHLENFVDIHNHILPGIDDGAKNTDESLALILGFAELGITHFVATPHIMHNYYPNTPGTITAALEKLQITLLQHNLKDISIEAAAEHMIDDNFENILKQGNIMPIHGEYLLVEMSYLQESINLESAIEKTTKKGYFPILAHPERYLYLKNKHFVFRELRKKGSLMQLNFLSLGDYYGDEVRNNAIRMLDDGLIDFVASDFHHLEHIQALKKIKLSNRILNKLLPVMEKTIDRFF